MSDDLRKAVQALLAYGSSPEGQRLVREVEAALAAEPEPGAWVPSEALDWAQFVMASDYCDRTQECVARWILSQPEPGDDGRKLREVMSKVRAVQRANAQQVKAGNDPFSAQTVLQVIEREIDRLMAEPELAKPVDAPQCVVEPAPGSPYYRATIYLCRTDGETPTTKDIIDAWGATMPTTYIPPEPAKPEPVHLSSPSHGFTETGNTMCGIEFAPGIKRTRARSKTTCDVCRQVDEAACEASPAVGAFREPAADEIEAWEREALRSASASHSIIALSAEQVAKIVAIAHRLREERERAGKSADHWLSVADVMERERDAAIEQMQGMIADPTLPEHLRANAHKLMASLLKTSKERDAAIAEREKMREENRRLRLRVDIGDSTLHEQIRELELEVEQAEALLHEALPILLAGNSRHGLGSRVVTLLGKGGDDV